MRLIEKEILKPSSLKKKKRSNKYRKGDSFNYNGNSFIFISTIYEGYNDNGALVIYGKVQYINFAGKFKNGYAAEFYF